MSVGGTIPRLHIQVLWEVLKVPDLNKEEGRLGLRSANHFAVVIVIQSPSLFNYDVDLNLVSPRAV